MPKKTVKPKAEPKAKPKAKPKVEEPKEEVKEFENKVTITFAYGKSKVTYEVEFDEYKQSWHKIWDKAQADLDELNAQA